MKLIQCLNQYQENQYWVLQIDKLNWEHISKGYDNYQFFPLEKYAKYFDWSILLSNF